VSDLAKRRGTVACPRCKAPMEEVVSIAPVQGEPGLIAYECPSCRYITSVLTPADGETGSR
jgi:transposase-like protein